MNTPIAKRAQWQLSLIFALILPHTPVHADRGGTAPGDAMHPPQLSIALQTTLDEIRREYGFPGATAAVVTPDRVVASVAAGLADREDRTPMTPRSRMLAASVGKSFVAATVLALDRDGTLDVDDLLKRWLGNASWLPRLPNTRTAFCAGTRPSSGPAAG